MSDPTGTGRVFCICDTESPPAYPILVQMNYDDTFISSTLVSLNWSTADAEHDPRELSSICGSSILLTSCLVIASCEPDGGIIRSDRQRARLNKRKKAIDELYDVRNELFEGEFDGWVLLNIAANNQSSRSVNFQSACS